eukprot:8310374-Pyramimonas_sp.AAC.1
MATSCSSDRSADASSEEGLNSGREITDGTAFSSSDMCLLNEYAVAEPTNEYELAAPGDAIACDELAAALDLACCVSEILSDEAGDAVFEVKRLRFNGVWSASDAALPSYSELS